MNEVNLWPFKFSSLQLCHGSSAQALIPKSLNTWDGGDGWGCPVLLVGQKNGSGSSRSPARFYFVPFQGRVGSPVSLRQVANTRGLHTF